MSRPQSGRVVAGVAAGLAQHLQIPVLYVRIALTVLTVMGGVGAMVYAGLWMSTPALDDGPSSRSQHQEQSRPQPTANHASLSVLPASRCRPAGY